VADVFISYSRGQRERVKVIADKLSALKLNVWFDAALPPGESFGDEVEGEINAAKCVGAFRQWVQWARRDRQPIRSKNGCGLCAVEGESNALNGMASSSRYFRTMNGGRFPCA
jgi:TIR domain-containing protein